MGRLDASGRITDRTVLAALGWCAGHRFAAAPMADGLIMCPDSLGPVSITGAGFLTIPAAQRRWCALAGGDRVLLVADPVGQVLVVLLPAALRAMVTRYLSPVTGGADGNQR